MDNLSDQLSCPICLEIPENQIFQCVNGHNVCGECCSPLQQCPQCRALYRDGKTRNRTVEAIIDSLKVICPNKSKGCTDRLLKDKLDLHLVNCVGATAPIKLCEKFGFNCGHAVDAGSIEKTINHLKNEHGAMIETRSSSILQLGGFGDIARSNHGKSTIWSPHVLKHGNSYFLTMASLNANNMLCCVNVFLGDTTSSNHATYESLFYIKSVSAEGSDLYWRINTIDLRKLEACSFPVPIQVQAGSLLENFLNSDGTVLVTISVSPKKILPAFSSNSTSISLCNKSRATPLESENSVFGCSKIVPTAPPLLSLVNDTQEMTLSGSSTNPFLTSPITDSQMVFSTFGPNEIIARCICDHIASKVGELSLKLGDIVKIISKETEEDGVWIGEINGNVGYFRSNNVQFMNGGKPKPMPNPKPRTSVFQAQRSSTIPNNEIEVKAICIESYKAKDSEEITVLQGEEIRIVANDILFHGWTKVKLDNRVGFVPADMIKPFAGNNSYNRELLKANQFRWIKCSNGEIASNAVCYYQSENSAYVVRAFVPGQNFKVIGHLLEGKKAARISFNEKCYKVDNYEMLSIPSRFWKLSEFKEWGATVPRNSIVGGVNPDGSFSYIGAIYIDKGKRAVVGRICPKEGLCYATSEAYGFKVEINESKYEYLQYKYPE